MAGVRDVEGEICVAGCRCNWAANATYHACGIVDADRGSTAEYKMLVDLYVVPRHAGRTEALIKDLADALSAHRGHLLESGDSFIYAVDDKAVGAIFDDFGNGAAGEGYNGRAAAHRLNHREAERLGPVYGEEEGKGVAQELVLFGLAYLADVLNQRVI